MRNPNKQPSLPVSKLVDYVLRDLEMAGQEYPLEVQEIIDGVQTDDAGDGFHASWMGIRASDLKIEPICTSNSSGWYATAGEEESTDECFRMFIEKDF